MAWARPSRRRGRGPGSQPPAPPSACSAIRRRTSTAVGAGYSSLPGRQPAAIFCGPGPSSAQTWQVLVKKGEPALAHRMLAASLLRPRKAADEVDALHDDGAQGAGQEFEVAAAALAARSAAGPRCV